MKRYLIEYDSDGTGADEESFVGEYESDHDARDAAYECAVEQAQRRFEENAIYSARELTKELAEEYGITWDEPAEAE